MTIPASLISFLATTAAAPFGPFGMPEQASSVAPEIDFVYEVITWICIIFFVLIVGLMVFFLVKYSKPPGTPAEGKVVHNTPIEITWTVLPLLMVIVIFYVGMQSYLKLTTAPLGAYEINVTAQKWNWTFTYKNGAQPKELIVPLGHPVKLIMSSQDVLHSLFIPAFRVKQDVVPGRLTTLWFKPTYAGNYDLFCAEYCGQQHSTMITRVIVLDVEDFEQRMIDEANWSDKVPAEKLYAGGPRLYARCKSCHSLDGTNMTGPSWKGLWDRTVKGEQIFKDGSTLKDHIGDGKTFINPEDYLMKSITNPREFIVEPFPGSMPTFQGQLNSLEIQMLIDFMKNLDKFDEKTGKPLDEADDLAKIIEKAEENQD